MLRVGMEDVVMPISTKFRISSHRVVFRPNSLSLRCIWRTHWYKMQNYSQGTFILTCVFLCSSWGRAVLGSSIMALSIDLFGLYANCSESWRVEELMTVLNKCSTHFMIAVSAAK